MKQLQTNQHTTPSSTQSVYETTTYTATTSGLGTIAQVTDPMGGTTSYSYDANGDVTQTVDPDNHVTQSTYDTKGNQLTYVTDPGSSGHLNLTTTRTYDAANNVLSQTDPDGIVTQYSYDSAATGDLMQVVTNYVSGGPTNADTNVTSTFTYDAYGEQVTATDPLGVVTKYTYDGQGDVTATTRNYVSGGPTDSQTNVTTSATYDSLGQEATSTDALGIVTQTTYDIRGEVTQVVDNYRSDLPPDSATNVTTKYSYDPLGRQVTSTNPLGVVTKTVYDADGRATQTIENYVSGGPTDAQTNVTSTTSYDGAGNATLDTDAAGNQTVTSFDLDNQGTEVQVKTSSGTVISDTKTTYSASGNRETSQIINGGANPTTSFTYDPAGRTTTEQDPPANPGAGGANGTPNVTTYTYSTAGNIVETKVTNAALNSPISDATATYDKLNRRTSQALQAGTSAADTTTYVYDAAGEQISATDNANQTTTTSYDALGQVLQVTSPDGAQETRTYDAGGRLLATTTAAGTTTDTYDTLGRVTQEQRKDASGAVQVTVSMTYDAAGDPLQQTTTDAGGTQVTFTATYDKLGRLTTMSDGKWTYTYDLAGNETGMTASDGGGTAIQVQRGYDASGRLASLTDAVGTAGTTLHSYSYTYDANGQTSTINTDGTATNYAYDELGQLLSATSGSNATSYAYDSSGNRTSMTVIGTGAGTTTYTYDSANVRLTSRTGPDGKLTSYGYDANGNVTSETYDPSGANQTTGYVYGPTGALSEVDKPDGSKVQFSYDGDRQRLTKTVATGGANPTTSEVKDVYDGGHVAYETDGNGTVLARFAYDMQGTPVSVQVGSDPNTAPRYYYVYNGHGDVVALVDASGATVASYSYDAFGALTSASESFPNGWSNPYRYDGRGGQLRYDAETGLYMESGRPYDPALGRYLTPDAGLSYVYAGNDPLGAGGGGAGSGGGGSSSAPVTPPVGDTTHLFHMASANLADGGGGGGDLTISLGGTTYYFSQVSNLKWPSRQRVRFVNLYGAVYAGRSGTNWLRAEKDFVAYLGGGNHPRIPHSPYWNGVDSGGLVQDMFLAAYDVQHGQGDAPKKSIHYWIKFICHPGVVFFWLAHDESIALASLDSSGRHLFREENGDERNFINAADWILFIVGVYEVGAANAGALLSMLRPPGRDFQWMFWAVLGLCGPQTGCVWAYTGLFYPKDYPAPWWWAWTPWGYELTRIGCAAPLFRGVC